MRYQSLSLAVANHVATITLTRPELRNAFHETTIAELTQAFASVAQMDDVRAVVLAAQGPAFCAGADLNWMKKMAGYSHAENHEDAMALAQMLRTIYLCPQPVIARVQGDCYAGGMGLIAACDIVLASEQANFCLSEVKLGLIPATISPYVIKAMGEQAARRYFVTAERFDAMQAQRIGLAHEVVPVEALDQKLAQLLKSVTGNSPHAVREAKRLVREVAGVPVTDALLQDTASRIAAIRASSEGREGVASFLDKRKPAWLAPQESR